MPKRRVDETIARRASEDMAGRIRRRRLQLGLTQAQLAELAGVNQGYLSSIERGQAEPSRRVVDALAIALDVPQGVLIGGGADHDTPQPWEVRPLPLLGSIPSGAPADSGQVERFPVLRHQWSPDFYCLRLLYDSMEPTLKPGDIVLVHYRPDVDPELVQGKICACLIDGTPTLQRVSVEVKNDRRTIVLRGDNPHHRPLLIHPEQAFSIQGIVLRLVSRDL